MTLALLYVWEDARVWAPGDHSCNAHGKCLGGVPGGSDVKKKNPPLMQETQIWLLGQEDTMEKGMATYSSILAGRIPWTEEPGRLQSIESQRVRQD